MYSQDRLLLTVVGSRYEVRSDDDRWIELMASLWAPLRVADDGADPGHVLTISRWDPESDGWSAFLDGRQIVATADDPWAMAVQLRYEIVQDSVGRSPGLALHAAALRRDGRGLLLLGQSGAGKTTLALDLADSGWDHLSDDMCVLEEDGTVTAVPLPLAVKSPARWGTLDGPAGGWPPPPTTTLLVPGRARRATKLTAPRVVFPTFEAGAAPELTALSTGRALALLAHHAGRPAELPALRRLIGGRTAYAVRYGDSREALGFMGRISQKEDEWC